MTMLTLDTRTRRQVDGSTCRRVLVLMGQQVRRVEDNTTSHLLSRTVLVK